MSLNKSQIQTIAAKSRRGEGKKSLEKIAYLKSPTVILTGLSKLLEGRDILRLEYAKHAENAAHAAREFSLDGRLVGDIGELLASLIYPITLTGGADKDFDGHFNENKNLKVQIRCTFRGESIAIKHGNGYFIAIELSENKGGQYRVIYNGPANIPWIYVNSNKSSGLRNIKKEGVKKLKQLALGTWVLLQTTTKDTVPSKDIVPSNLS